MSVLVSDRKESRFEVITLSVSIREKLIELMHRGFGIKDIRRAASRRYAFGKAASDSPAEFVLEMTEYKRRLGELAAQLTNNLRAANSIYPTSVAELEQRRSYQNTAIANCEQILGEFQIIAEVFEVDLNTFGDCVNAVDREIGLIKRWRQGDNRLRSRLG